MKNPLEYALLEVEALLREDADGPQKEFTILLRYVHERQKYLKEYAVQRERELAKASETLPRRKVRNLDSELLDECEVVTLEETG